MQMALRTLRVGELRSPNSTPRHHSKKQRTKARALFAEQGIVLPIIVDDRMRIIDGVLRFETAKELGLDELNAVVVSNSTDAQLLQLELSLNRLAEDSAWNDEDVVAETKGFEPSRRFLAYSLSRGAPSTTRPHLQECV